MTDISSNSSVYNIIDNATPYSFFEEKNLLRVYLVLMVVFSAFIFVSPVASGYGCLKFYPDGRYVNSSIQKSN